MKILSAAQIREWDQYTIKHEPISSINLMERAAAKCIEWILNHYSGYHRIRIFCGKGNNGGDGLAIARQLYEKGIEADVYILESGNAASRDFEINLHRLHQLPLPVNTVEGPEAFPVIEPNVLVIDCLFGSGLNRPLDGLAASLVNHINNARVPTISIDLPSGMFADKSTVPNSVIKATHTLTFQTLKLCLVFPENEEYTGDVHVLNIGLHQGYLPKATTDYILADTDVIKQIYKPRKKFSHKGTYGHTLIVAGEKGKMGAALLCLKGCLRSGSGLVTGLVPKDEFPIIQVAAPEAMALPVEEIASLAWSKYNAMGIGPGIGTSEVAASIVEDVVSNFPYPVVIDADGLNILSQSPACLTNVPKNSILTPHPKEFERLFGLSNNNYERLELARLKAHQSGLYIIVKGHYSMLACPDGEIYFNSTGNPGMATGGSGDVLTGILAGLLSQGYSSKHAAILGMYVHGLSGDIAADKLSQEALIAADLIEHLGAAWLRISS